MKVRLNDLYLSEGGPLSPSGLSIQGAPSTERSDPTRGSSPSFFDRKTRTHTDSFSVTRQHASLSAAEHFLRAHAKDLDANAVGVFEFIAETDSGGAGGKWSARGRLTGYSAQQIGITTIWTYNLEYGALS